MTMQDRCPECGAPIPGGRAGCQAVYDELAARAYSNPEYASAHLVGFDAYCVQHLTRYCRSAKSYAAHLTRLCCGLEYGGDPQVYAAIQKWLNGPAKIDKPEAPSYLGRMTVADARAARDAQEYSRLVNEWARSVWEAYAGQHELARRWIEEAAGRQGGRVRG